MFDYVMKQLKHLFIAAKLRALDIGLGINTRKSKIDHLNRSLNRAPNLTPDYLIRRLPHG